MNPGCKDSKLWLLDLDNFKQKGALYAYLLKTEVEISDVVDTPNGTHFVVEPFNRKEIDLSKFDVEIKMDALLFVEKI